MRYQGRRQLTVCRLPLALVIAMSALAASTPNLSAADDPVAAPATASLNPLASVGLDVVADFVQKPLFSASRRPVRPAPAPLYVPPPPPAPPSAANLLLVGTVQMPTGAFARIQQTAAGSTRSLTVGETVDGWTVTRIDTASVQLEQSGQTAELQLFQDRPSPAPAPGRAPLPAASPIVAPPPAVARAPATSAAPKGTLAGTAAAEAAANSPYNLDRVFRNADAPAR